MNQKGFVTIFILPIWFLFIVVCLMISDSLLSACIAVFLPLAILLTFMLRKHGKTIDLENARWEKVKELLHLSELPEGKKRKIDISHSNMYFVELKNGIFQIKFKNDSTEVEGITVESSENNEE